MITASEFLDLLEQIGCRHLSGVPCSFLSRLYERLDADERYTYVPAANEGTAFALVAGMMLGGTESALLVQNSGLGNLVNPLTSLAMPYRLPVLTFMTMRGWPAADPEEPQHEVMGRATVPLLAELGVPHHVLPETVEGAREMLARVQEERRAGWPSFVLVPGRIPGERLSAAVSPATEPEFTRGEAIAELRRLLPDSLWVSTTGYISRDLFQQGDAAENLYLQGSMGHASAVAAGIALSRPDHRVVVIDGDGSALMHLGAMSTVGRISPNLVHAVLDNGTYESTGGQATTAASTAFTEIATACGYRRAISVGTAEELRAAARVLQAPGSVLAHLRIAPRSPAAGSRASGSVSVDQLARRFAAHVQGGQHAEAPEGLAGNPVRLGPVGGR
ncbi:phosphonopyruvate decarboxylase [Micromonospora sp. C95]|uniref:phosphonopyruvate decarboxylase n=1 Tax=Micromonospora sp. C95 TaxID=2824882 RepID=UPI001B37C6E5|nr:phosphonopyruvate decarboxylase [Micromonospora sp. C95]MBQ1023936.1 phosphonopyruvate decarboxylase [Micromonospora sp. C95]